MSVSEKRMMVSKAEQEVSLTKQCELLKELKAIKLTVMTRKKFTAKFKTKLGVNASYG